MENEDESRIMAAVGKDDRPFLRKSNFGGLDLVLNDKLVRYYSHIRDGNNINHFNIRYDFTKPYNDQVKETGGNVVNVFSVTDNQLTEVVKYLIAVKDFYQASSGLELDDRIGEEFNSRINRVKSVQSYSNYLLEKTATQIPKIHLDRREKGGLALAMDQRLMETCCEGCDESSELESVTLNHYYLNPNRPDLTFTVKEEGGNETDLYTIKKEQLPSLIEYLTAMVDNLEFSKDQKIKDNIGQRYRSNNTNPLSSQI